MRLIDFAKLFINGELDVHGSIDSALDVASVLDDVAMTTYERIRDTLLQHLATVIRRIRLLSRKQDLSPYDALPPEAYRLFLDEHMQYTCALFQNPHEDLTTGQVNKLRFIANRLQLTGGNRHLDVGCGWGGAIRYFVEQYRCRAIGITNSQEQARYAKARLVELPGAQVVCSDFASFTPREAFDSISVVGMLEHVPRWRHPQFFQYLNEKLKNGGRAYIQCITKSPSWMGGDGTRFLQRYVFPGYDIDTIDNIVASIRRAGLCVAETDILEHGVH